MIYFVLIMVLQIAGIGIKVTCNSKYLPATDYFFKACESFSLSDNTPFDF